MSAAAAAKQSLDAAESSHLSATYQQKTEREHILSNPDTYVGSVELTATQDWIAVPPTTASASASASGAIANSELEETDSGSVSGNDVAVDADADAETTSAWRVRLEPIQFVPAFLKLFDEVVVNARDHAVRTRQPSASSAATQIIPVSTIDVRISTDPNDGTITVTNDGSGIDVAQHPESGIYIPEMVFARLRTSTNYNKDEKKIVGGKNGFGIKLVFIWSIRGSIETVDHVRQLKYVQKFDHNLATIHPPKITKCTTKPYTRITFTPDYARLGMTAGLDDNARRLLQKRVLDIAAVTDKAIKVRLDAQLLPVRTFAQYVDLYVGASKTAAPRVHETHENGRWEYVVALSPVHEFAQVSFVNGICTSKGGKHVDYVLGQLTRKMVELVEKKRKVKINAAAIKEQLILFLRCDVENPSFDSQTKDFLTTPAAKFGSSCTVSDSFVEKVARLGVLDAACAISEVKDQKAAKKSDGSKSRSVRGIPKLMDANFAGTDKSSLCTLIFCEGDSAKAGVVSGLSQEDRNFVGVYPMKGKPMNVRGETTKRVAENKEIAEIKKILGLESGRKYESVEAVAKHLRYGKVLFMTDQDLDGSHIKGLCLNLFACEWKSLLRVPGFLGFMNTPILKATRGSRALTFYNEGQYAAWKASPESSDGGAWHIKYYKGLGTSTGKEFREYFQQKKVVHFEHTGDASDEALDLVFNKKKTAERKEWLRGHDPQAFLDTDRTSVDYARFFDDEYRHFSIYDCARSLPHVMDGLKTSQRKILYAAFKKPLTREVKVAQFSGYVAEQSGYHHGEASLNAAIVGMAQDFVGSNNIHLLMPNGQMGTRLRGGADSASERYIFTQLSPLTRCLFCEEDDDVLTYLEDDGDVVEPAYYAPILPMVLVNGCKGIGTGYSTDILSYDPRDLVQHIQRKLQLCVEPGSVAGAPEEEKKKEKEESDDAPLPKLHPYYENFRGTITPMDAECRRYLLKGVFEVKTSSGGAGDKVRVRELPVGFWTSDFKEYLELLMERPDLASLVDSGSGAPFPVLIRDYVDMSTDTVVDFEITFSKGSVEWLIAQKGMESLDCGMLNGMEKLLKLYSSVSTTNMHAFNAAGSLTKYTAVEEILDDYFGERLEMYNKRKTHLLSRWQASMDTLENKYRYIDMLLSGWIDLRGKRRAEVELVLSQLGFEGEKRRNESAEEGDLSGTFNYLLRLPMDSVTRENVDRLREEVVAMKDRIQRLSGTTPAQLWRTELDRFLVEYTKFRELRAKERLSAIPASKTAGGGGVASRKKAGGGAAGKKNGTGTAVGV